jgi:hypothetical protein
VPRVFRACYETLLSPLRGSSLSYRINPTTCVVGCILSPLRGFLRISSFHPNRVATEFRNSLFTSGPRDPARIDIDRADGTREIPLSAALRAPSAQSRGSTKAAPLGMTPFRKEELGSVYRQCSARPTVRLDAKAGRGLANWIGKIVDFIWSGFSVSKYEAPSGLWVRGGRPHLWLIYALRNAWGCRCGWSRGSVTRNTADNSTKEERPPWFPLKPKAA